MIELTKPTNEEPILDGNICSCFKCKVDSNGEERVGKTVVCRALRADEFTKVERNMLDSKPTVDDGVCENLRKGAFQ